MIVPWSASLAIRRCKEGIGRDLSPSALARRDGFGSDARFTHLKRPAATSSALDASTQGLDEALCLRPRE